MRESRQVSSARGAARFASTRARLVLFALALCLAAVATAGAQSGRRKPPPLSPAPTPSPTPEGESESQPRAKSEKAAEVTFAVYESDGASAFFDFRTEELVMDAFVERLTRNRELSATRGGKSTRKQAQERAKKETASYVVLVELENDTSYVGQGGVGQGDTRTVVVKTYVYEPGTGTLKYMDRTYQRPYRPTTSVGGVAIPLPVPRTRVERFPNELQLEQAARDAADRVMMRFRLRLPPDN